LSIIDYNPKRSKGKQATTGRGVFLGDKRVEPHRQNRRVSHPINYKQKEGAKDKALLGEASSFAPLQRLLNQ
jgi:hypothetical protein